MYRKCLSFVQRHRAEVWYFGVLGTILLLINRYKLDLQLLWISPTRRSTFWDTLVANAGDFLTLSLSIIVEALPFIVLGVGISVLIQMYMPTDKVIKLLPKNTALRGFIVSCLGVLMPVCECGNVPVARSLMAKGFKPQEAITFLLAAPSVNIITVVVTLEAFGFNRWIAVVRVVATIIIANLTAMVVARYVRSDDLLTDEFKATCEVVAHDHSGKKGRLTRTSRLFRSEMWMITRLLVVGALIAAASQTFVPREVITDIGSNLFLSAIAMLALAFVISICSSVDAFFALAYVSTFNLGAIMAFLVAGPMVDIKMIALLKTTFTAKALALMSATVLLLTIILGWGLSYVW